MSFNKVTLTGNITKDIELKYTPKGTAICAFSLAVNRVWYSDDNTKHEEVTFVEIEYFGKTAENIGKYFGKGGAILVYGRLKQDTWNDKETGKKRSKLKVIGDSFEFMGRNGKEQGDESEHETKERTTRQQPKTEHRRTAPLPDPDLDSGMDDDVPF